MCLIVKGEGNLLEYNVREINMIFEFVYENVDN